MLSKFLRITEPEVVRTFTAFLPPPLSIAVRVTEKVYYVYYVFLPMVRVQRTKYRVGHEQMSLSACGGCRKVLVDHTEYDGTLADCLAYTAADIHLTAIEHSESLLRRVPKC